MAQQVFDQVPFKEHTANGLTTVFAFDFQVLEAGDLVVYRDGVVAPASDFTLAGLGVAAGGTVTFTVAPANGVIVLLSREISLERLTEYQTLGDFKAVIVNPDFNRLWMALQGMAAKIGGTLRFPFPEQPSALPAAAARANGIQAYDADGDPVVIAGFASDSAVALDLNLRNGTLAAKGAGQVAFGFGLTYDFLSVGGQLNDLRPFCPEMFGAPSTWDGVSDDTTAFTQMVAAVNAAGGGHVHLRRTYYIAQTGLPNAVNIEFTDCDGLVIESKNGAKILRKGNFVHSSTLTSSNIVMRRCTRVLTMNLEIDGQVSTGTKSGTEQGEHGLQMFGCKDVTHINPYLHDNPNDGLYVDHEFSGGLITVRSERITVVNGLVPNNGRQGMSLIGVFGASFWNADFIDTGKTGAFGFYSPAAGVDIEPNSATELCVNNVHFHGCRFKGNLGSAFVCVNQASVARPGIAENGNVNNVWLHGCEFASDAAATGSDQVILAVKNGGIIGGSTDFRAFGGASSARMVLVYADYLSATQLAGHKITGKKQVLLAAKDATRTAEEQRVTIDGCEIISADTTTNGGAIFAQLDCGGKLEDTRFYVPSAAYSTGAATRETVRLFKLFRVLGNTYETNMSTVGQKFLVTTTGAESVTLERYKQPTFFGV